MSVPLATLVGRLRFTRWSIAGVILVRTLLRIDPMWLEMIMTGIGPSERVAPGALLVPMVPLVPLRLVTTMILQLPVPVVLMIPVMYLLMVPIVPMTVLQMFARFITLLPVKPR